MTRLFILLLFTLAAVVILSPPTSLEKELQTHVIYIHSPSSAAGAAGAGAASQQGGEEGPGDGKGNREGAASDEDDEGDGGGDDDDGKAATSGYKRCPEVLKPSRPSLEGMPLGFNTSGRRRLSPNDTFIHKGNYEQLLHGEYTLHRRTIPLLPDSYEDVTRNFKFDSCAVVGNSGYLKLAQFGAAIDSHDVVVRLNQSPTKAFARWVGSKTSIRILNSLWSAHYGSGRFQAMNLPLEKNLTIVVSRTTGHAFDKIVDTMKKVSHCAMARGPVLPPSGRASALVHTFPGRTDSQLLTVLPPIPPPLPSSPGPCAEASGRAGGAAELAGRVGGAAAAGAIPCQAVPEWVRPLQWGQHTLLWLCGRVLSAQRVQAGHALRHGDRERAQRALPLLCGRREQEEGQPRALVRRRERHPRQVGLGKQNRALQVRALFHSLTSQHTCPTFTCLSLSLSLSFSE